MTLLGWLGVRLHSRQDAIETKMNAHEKSVAEDYITREVFNGVIDDMRTERQRMHDENRETLQRIHSRVDDLWRNRN